MNAKLIKTAFVKTLPVLTGYVILGIGFGILLNKEGYGILWSFAMGLTIYAGSMQYVGVGLIGAGASFLTTALTTLLVNCRHLFYGISMVERYKDAGAKKPYLIFGLTDETYSLVCTDEIPEGLPANTYRFTVSWMNQCYWLTGCVLGSIIGAALPFNSEGIDFVMTALFVTIVIEQWKSTKEHLPVIVGVLASVVCLVIFGAENFLIPSMLVITVILTLFRKRLEENLNSEKEAV